MEYKLSSSEDWTNGTGATITNLANGTYNVRYKATATHKAGASANVVGTSVSAKSGHPISWARYCKISGPATVMVILISTIYIWIVYL